MSAFSRDGVRDSIPHQPSILTRIVVDIEKGFKFYFQNNKIITKLHVVAENSDSSYGALGSRDEPICKREEATQDPLSEVPLEGDHQAQHRITTEDVKRDIKGLSSEAQDQRFLH